MTQLNASDISRFKALDSGSEIRAFFRDIVSRPTDLKLTSSPASGATEVCHVCKGGFRLPALIEKMSQVSEDFQVHMGCHTLRARWSTLGIMFGMRVGLWINKQWMDNGTKSWRGAGLKSFLEDHGHDLLETIELCRVDAIKLLGGRPTPESYLRYVRAIFLDERERSKWEVVGEVVPEWNEHEVTWQQYKKDIFRPAYKAYRARVVSEADNKRTSLPSVTDRTGGLCALCCGPFISSDGLQAASDHIVPHVKGGGHTTANLQPLHHFCNNTLGSLGAGDIPLAMMIGRWMMNQLESNKASWADHCFSQYATELRSNAKRAAKPS